MGYNTGILILNDAVPAAQRDPKGFAENLLEAVREFPYKKFPYGRDCRDFAIGNNVNGGSVIYHGHADQTGIIAIGGNCATVLGTPFGYVHHTPERQIDILSYLAEERGYKLVKK